MEADQQNPTEGSEIKEKWLANASEPISLRIVSEFEEAGN